MNGAILENYVVAEIVKTYLNCGMEPYLYYYRDKDAKSSATRSKGAVICMKPGFGAIDRNNYIVPVWKI